MLMVNQLVGFGAGAAEPNGVDEFTKLMLHFDGADGSTTCIDSSSAARTMSRTGDPEIDTAQSKFGGSSGLFNAGRWQAPDDSDLELGSNDFTIDFWVRSASWGTGVKTLITKGNNADYWTGFHTNGPTLYFTGTTNNAAYNFSAFTSFATLSDNTWQHVAASRSGNNLYLFLDGSLLSTRTVTGLSVYDFGHGWAIGSRNDAGGHLTGWIDELRISIGIARWTATFTPPTVPYS